MMTPGDFASLQEGREGLSTEDYIAWKLPEEEDVDEYPFPLTLKQKGKGSQDVSGSNTPTTSSAPMIAGGMVNGNGT